jgi:hypothetical protein
MTISSIGGNDSLSPYLARYLLRDIGQTQTSGTDASQGGSSAQQTASTDSSQAGGGTGQAQSSLAAMLGAMMWGGAAQGQDGGMPPPPPPPDGGMGGAGRQRGEFAKDLGSLLQSVQSGDMTGAQSAAAAIQGLRSGTPDSDTTSSDSATSATASGQDSNQSTFNTDLNALLSAVQTGDSKTSQTAANAVIGDLRDAARKPQGTGRDMPPPPPDRQGGGRGREFSDNLASLVQSVQSGDMTSAQTAATVLQKLLPDSEKSSSDSASASATASSSSATQGASSSSSRRSTFVTDLSAVLSAVQTGDTTTSQSAVAAMLSDLQSAATEAQAMWSGGGGAGYGVGYFGYGQWS